MKIKKLYSDALIPTRNNPTDSGLDVYAHNIGSNKYSNQELYVLQPFDRVLVGTGIALSIDNGYEVQVRPRSGLAIKYGISIVNTPGTVDQSYRGEICVILINLNIQPFTILKGMKIAQIVECPVRVCDFEIVEEFSDDTERGTKGFGSSGI